LDYKSDALATIAATLQMDRCVLVYWYYLLNNFLYYI
jgi:hypothetical protein